MSARIAGRFEHALPPDDDHPYRTGAWTPNTVEYDVDALELVHGAVPRDLAGVYLRNTENPLLPSIGRYHPFDGDGMLHAVHFRDGRASYRNRMVRTKGLAAELEAGRPLWAGIIESPASSERDGWGARTRMKDASSTDVVVHAGKAITTFYQCGEAYQHDPITLEDLGPATWGGRFPSWGISAHPKVDERTGELLWFSYSKEAPYLRYGVLDARGAPVHETEVPLPGPRLPHDMAFTERFAIFNDLPVFWDPALLERGIHRPRFYKDTPSRFGLLPRRAHGSETRWFEAEPTYVLHWINAYEDGDEVVLDGYFQRDPLPKATPADGPWGPLMRQVDVASLGCEPHRWRFDLRTGKTREETLPGGVSEFPMIHGRYGGVRNRYTWAMTTKPGWFLFNGLVRIDLETGETQRFQYPDGVYASESPMCPRQGSTREDDGYVVTLVSDVNRDRSEVHIFDAARIDAGPVAALALPHRVCAGTHSFWAPASTLGAP